MIRPAACERTRAYVSLRLDGELAELEQRMLDAHLPACSACSAYADDVAAATRAVRATPLAQLRRPLAPRVRRARPVRVHHVAAVAAGVLVVVGAGTAVDRGGDVTRRQTASPLAWPTPKRYLSDAALREEQSLLALTKPGSPLPQLRF
ncbi:MAG TPA: zf-HC2 domain-containing protein [Gaiellaceae bacterium]|nr:zf-HC2 domain-containing protein [Gaiellaceae bacterium]